MRNLVPGFLAIFLSDLVVRTAYMSAKSPVLPVFADALGANAIVLGAIVSVSTITGVIAKPIFGFLSDRNGRLIWLAFGTLLFAAVPVLYLGVSEVEHLLGLRLVHGLATAVYGPVTLAYLADLAREPRAGLYGFFSLARTFAYILGPLIGGALLSIWDPRIALAATGGLATLAFLPVAFLSRVPQAARGANRTPVKLGAHLRSSLLSLLANKPLALFGVVEMVSRISTYAIKAFLPIMILRNGGTALEAGVFLSAQEAVSAVLRPVSGAVADRFKITSAVAVTGLVILSLALVMLPALLQSGGAIFVAIAIGVGQGIYAPAALALIARASRSGGSGTAFGVVGSLRNLGKVLGPVLGGSLLSYFQPQHAFLVLGLAPLLAAGLLIGGKLDLNDNVRAKYG